MDVSVSRWRALAVHVRTHVSSCTSGSHYAATQRYSTNFLIGLRAIAVVVHSLVVVGSHTHIQTLLYIPM